MTHFYTKKIKTPPRFCLALKQARIARGVAIEDIAKMTRINVSHLIAIEECKIEDIPLAPVYLKQYIRSYARAVGIQEETLLRSFAAEKQTCTPRAETIHPPRNVGTKWFFNLPRLLRWSSMLFFVLLLAGGMGYQLTRFLQPPKLTIISPAEGLITHHERIIIAGYTEKEVALAINGIGISGNENGHFQTEIPLQNGANIISVQATKKSGRQTTQIRTVVRNTEGNKISKR